MIAPIVNQLGQAINQATPQVVNFVQQELSKPQTPFHIYKVVKEILK